MLTIIGIRHHGPASARCVEQTLGRFKPDCVLLEGPPEAEEQLCWVGHRQLQPPVALLVYAPERPDQAIFYPLAEFSPEWQALLYASKNKIPVHFIDLPGRYQMKIEEEEEQLEAIAPESPIPEEMEEITPETAAGGIGEAAEQLEPEAVHRTEADESQSQDDQADDWSNISADPFRLLAHVAGYEDPERWWDCLIEHRRSIEELPEAVLELMTALRQEVEREQPPDRLTLVREAAMRQRIREARRQGYERMVVVCGAWHAPALVEGQKTEEEDRRLLEEWIQGATHPKEVVVTWVPWSYRRLASESGYRAGVASPAWYEYLWRQKGRQVVASWMARAARLLRAEGMDISTAHAIEATRLAETLAVLRERSLPDLHDMEEAMQAVYCHRDSAPLQWIRQRLIIGERRGQIPDELKLTPLYDDIVQTCKRLKLDHTTLRPLRSKKTDEPLDLDLRQPLDRQRSVFFHRLRLLDLPLRPSEWSGAQGTFHELWDIKWGPETVIDLVDRSVYGNVVAEAASRWVLQKVETADLQQLGRWITSLLHAELPAVLTRVLLLAQEKAAHSTDINELMAGWPAFAKEYRYGGVRRSDQEMLRWIVEQIFVRICLYLPQLRSPLKEEAVHELSGLIMGVHEMVTVLNEEQQQHWWLLLQQLMDSAGHGRLQGQFTRWLYDGQKCDDILVKFHRILSPGTPPSDCIAWLEGFFGAYRRASDDGDGVNDVDLLIHVPALLRVLDTWLLELPEERFIEQLPLLRRIFGRSHQATREHILRALCMEPDVGQQVVGETWDQQRAALAATWADLLDQWEREATP